MNKGEKQVIRDTMAEHAAGIVDASGKPVNVDDMTETLAARVTEIGKHGPATNRGRGA